MGRSKFPGKPPKTVTRKRIKVLGRPQAAQSDTVTVAENIYYGISVFGDSFHDNEKELPPFHGFSSKEAKLSVSYVKTKQHDSNNKAVDNSNSYIAHGHTKDIESLLMDTKKLNKNAGSKQNSKKSTCVEKTVVQTRCGNTQQLSEPNKTKVSKSVKFKRMVRAPVLKSVNNILDRHQRTRQLRNSTAKRLLQRAKFNVNSNNRNITILSRDKPNGVKKFVLPMRSAHSSRVIKPNKRFIEELEETPSNEGSENGIIKLSKKAKTIQGKSVRAESKIGDILSLTDDDGRDAKIRSKKNAQCTNTQPPIMLSKSIGITGNNLEDTQKERNENEKDLSSNVENVGKTVFSTDVPSKTAETNLSMDSRPISIPPKVLPTVDILIVESSKISTRSGLLSDSTVNENEQINEHNQRESEKQDEIVDCETCTVTNNKDPRNMVIVKIQENNSKNNNEAADSSLSESGSEQSNHSDDEQSEWTGMKLDGGKVILRKARLKLENKNSGGPEGPFSVTNGTNSATGNMNPGMTGTVKCGVCGAVRFYRFVKQARKFGIHSCESCRKFISKMIKRQACAKSANNTLPILQCLKGDGMCLVPPVVRSQQWNLMRCVYKTRCPACWLKMCLKCYNITSSVKAELNALLPSSMRDPVISLGSLSQQDSDILGQKTIESIISWPAEDSMEKNLFKSAISWSGIEIGKKLGYQSNVQGLLSKKFNKIDYPISMSLSKKRKKETRIKVRKKMKNCHVPLSPSTPPTSMKLPSPPPLSSSASSPSSSLSLSATEVAAAPLQPPSSSSTSSTVTTNQSSLTVRQRIDVKGPRVKHVCRSASVALGQPIATFPTCEGKEETDITNKSISKSQKEDSIKSEIVDEITKEKYLHRGDQGYNANTANNLNQQHLYTKRIKTQQNNLAPNHQVVRSSSKITNKANHEISIDFWEQYDPAEVGATGFALITSETFHISAICFLCGSAGKDPLIHCQCCCEPYHAFCLEPSEWNVCVESDWCCPRCTICQTCHLRTGPKLACIRCRQSFHHSCLSKSGINARLYSPDRPYICQNCVKCKSCGSEGVNVYVGNLPLCSMCFKLRQRGNYCPLCQRCYNENDFDTKMMECNECSCWIHARCEGLSDEYYQVLSSLPDSVEFNCSQCSPNLNSSWRSAIENELNAGFIAVIKALIKNRKICAALKLSPRKECLCKPVASVRKLDFGDDKFDREMGDEIEEIDNRSVEFNAVGAAKIDPLSRFDFEVDDQPTDVPKRGMRRLKRKFHLKECSVRVRNCVVQDDQDEDISGQESLTTLSEDCSCQCPEQQMLSRPSPTLMSVKRKVNGKEYHSLLQFHCDMEHVINRIGVEDLLESYHKLLQEVFPWFDPKRSKINSGGSGFSTPTKDMCRELDLSMTKLDDSIIEKWKEEVLTASKSIRAKTGNIYVNGCVEDSRYCALCKRLGDGEETIEGRLLYCGRNEWIHSNCALWSNEVFEEIDGSLQNVHSAISRGRLIRCSNCGKKGASVGCCAKNCSNTYHFLCAKNTGLCFNDDKTIFCSSHISFCASKNPHNEDEFGVKRLVYVELDRKKKKYAEPHQIKVMIGSLMIECLGKVIPEFSDSHEKIFPINYECSRLYWSTINPMRIVKYYIRSYVQTRSQETVEDVEHNITIDHSKEQEKEEWQRLEHLVVKQTLDTLIDSVYSREMDENLAEQNNTDLLPPEITDVIFEDLPHDLLDGISMQDIFPKMSYEDFLAMDFKNDGVFGTDLLKDEILTSEVDEIIKLPDSKTSKLDPTVPEFGLQNDLWLHLETKGCVQELMDDLLNSKTQKVGGKELRRSKSEVISNNSLVLGGSKHQRSCSLTWSCKLDGTYGPPIKRRKLPSRPPSSTRTGETNVMLLDPHNDKAPMFHELRIPESIMVTVGRTNKSNLLTESVKELKYCIEDSAGINRISSLSREDNKDHKRLLWHTHQHPRILQVDGSADPSSTSECSSPEYNIEERIPQVDGTNDVTSHDNLNRFTYTRKLASSAYTNSIETCQISMKNMEHNIYLSENDKCGDNFKIPQLDGADDISSDDESPLNVKAKMLSYVSMQDSSHGPVTCKRCQCTYRTHDSYDRHLINCDIVTTSDSDSETIDNKGASHVSRFSDSIIPLSPQFVTLSPSEGQALTGYSNMQVTSPLEASVPSPLPPIQIEPIAQAIITPQIHTHATVETVHQTVLTSNDVIVQTQYTRTTTTLPNPTTVLPPDNTSVHITEITDTPLSNDTNITTNITLSQNKNCQVIVSSPQSSPTISDTSYTHGDCIEAAKTNHNFSKMFKPKSPRTSKSRVKMIKPQVMRSCIPQQMEPIRYQAIQNATPIQIQLQQQSRSAAPTVILQQVPPQGLMPAYVETLQQQSGQNLQYITTIGGQDGGYKPQFITTNQIVPGTYIQTASENFLALPNGGISVLPSVQITQSQPTVLGTIIQPQPSAIQCGVISSEQLVLSSTPALEMFTDSTGSMFVSSHPLYYGLETIVSNTVMSSSQFMAGAVPQVLASSYQTTTQVFQASKLLEPIVDVQTVPNVSTMPAVQGITNVANVPSVRSVPSVQTIRNVPSAPVLQSVQNIPAVQAVQAVQAVPNVHNIRDGYVVVNSATTPDAISTPHLSVTTSSNSLPVPHDQSNLGGHIPTHQSNVEPIIRSIQPLIQPLPQCVDVNVKSTSPLRSDHQTFTSIPRVAVRPNPVSHAIMQNGYDQWKIPETHYSVEQSMSSSTIPYLDSKHVSENTSMIKFSLSSKIPPLSNHYAIQRDISNKLICDVNSVHSGLMLHSGLSDSNSTSSNLSAHNQGQSKPSTFIAPTTRPMNRVLPMQAVAPKQETIKPEMNVEKLTKPGIKFTHNKVVQQAANSLNRNDADEIIFISDQPFEMGKCLNAENKFVEEDRDFTDQTMMLREISLGVKKILSAENPNDEEKCLEDGKKIIKENNGRIDHSKSNSIELNCQVIEESKENLKFDLDNEKLQNSSLKIVLQKQLQDGSYKITHSMKTKNSPKITSVEILPSKQTPHIASLQLLPIKTFTVKTNKIDEKPRIVDKDVNFPKAKSPPIAVKQPRFISKSNNRLVIDSPGVNTDEKMKPRLMYEIKSQDGFIHTASSMTEIWESVFQAVQTARRSHNLPLLAHNPLNENLGLDNNASVYLIEQLAGVNRCTKYRSKYHNLAPPKSLDSDILSGTVNGAVRAEPFTGRKVHDMFSWLASRHRQQPKIIAVSENEIRRAACSNLPMAMRFRMLKETSKQSVGVYHSHIHGRGLFCLRDIETGEMVIEYAGEVIRASLTDKREKYYDSKHIGCYMFKIDDHFVVDATMKGNAARFINHSCEPNCYSKVVDILGKKHILIFALRRIVQGEELTYDYKFPFEDIKIPCTCGSRKCRKYLN